MQYHLRPRLHARSGGAQVRIAEDLRKCVVFVGLDQPDEDGEDNIAPGGTGFFVVWGGDLFGHGQPATYLVTAKHVAENLGTKFAVRFNKPGAGSRTVIVD